MSNNQLKGSSTVTLHTHFANRAISGRMKNDDKSPIPSLFQFNSLTNVIYKSCKLDDPFAWFALVDLETKIEDIEKKLQAYQVLLDEALAVNNDRIKIEKTVSEEPETHTVNVSNYGFRLLDMISVYDQMCCDCFGAIHRCRIPYEEGYIMMNQGSHALRRGLSAGLGYSYTGITRKDLQQQNKKAVATLERFVNSRLIDATKFNGVEDMCQFFAAYSPKTTFGPMVLPRKLSSAAVDDKVSKNKSKTTAPAKKTKVTKKK